MNADLEGKKVLVTGASSGIDLATVETFARRGATVALNYHPDDPRGAIDIVDRLNKDALGHEVRLATSLRRENPRLMVASRSET